MKKVLFTATVDSHMLQFHLPFLKLFKEKGYEVHVATNGNEEIPYCDVKHIISFERSPFKLKNLKAIKQLRKICNEEKFDIIHTHTPMGSVVTRLAAKQARRKYHTRVIYTAHGLHFFKGAPLINWLLFYPVEKYLSKYTDTLILINMEDYERCKKHFKKCKDIQYVPGVGVDIEKFNLNLTNQEKKKMKESLGLKENDYVLTCVARLDKNKSQGFLIEVVEELVKEHNNIHLLLVGPDELNGQYQQMAKEKNLENNVHFLGFRKDIPQILAITDIVLSASKREGLPVNVMEALASGKPVVAMNCRGMQELVINNKNGYITDNKEDYISSITKIYKNPISKEDIKKNSNIKDTKDIVLDLSKIYFKKKKVLHILASNKFSGAENVACTIISNMKDEYEMIYCCPRGEIEKQLKEKNIAYMPIKKLSYFEIKKVVKKINPDIIHAHDNKATVVASLFHNKYKIISHIHGNNKIMNTKNIKTMIFNLCSKNIDEFIWVSDSSYDDYIYKYSIKDKSQVLYNVVDTQNILLKSKDYECDEKYDIIYLGRLGYPKNPERFIEIVKLIKEKNKNIKVAIVGDGDEREKVENLIEKYNLKDNIKMYGFISNPYPILKNSKILVMTSIYEGTPMCALEAQSLEKPIVATPVDGLKKIIENDINGFLSNDNTKIMSKIIEYLEKNRYKKLSKNTENRFKLNNNMIVYCKKISDIYK